MQPMLNTDLLAPSGTLTLAFAPTTPGNWLLHCHFSFHMDETVTLAGSHGAERQALKILEGALVREVHASEEERASALEFREELLERLRLHR